MKSLPVFLLSTTILWFDANTPVFAGDAPAQADTFRFFETRIGPLLAEQCLICHGSSYQRGNLRLDSADALKQPGRSGELPVISGQPEKSLLIRMVRHTDKDKRMPLCKEKLSERQIADLIEWIKMGAAFPPKLSISATQKHWAFQPPVEPAIPTDKNKARPPTLDQFILAGLEAKGLRPAAPADRRTLIRRATFDLIGLPPTPDEVEAFVKASASSPNNAYEALIDRLLASPAYGEHWGRHWLDVARYADSNGLDENVAFGNAWRYRDYVVESFNKDKPYDQFIREQIAGDLMPSSDASIKRERLIATGFLALGPKVLAEPDAKKMEMDIIDEQVDTLGRAMMGLTLGCARCHDHKFDPLSTEDYYGLAGIFMSTKTMEHFTKIARWYENPIPTAEEIARKAEHDKKVLQLKEAIKTETDGAELKKLKETLAKLEKAVPETSTAMGAAEGKVTNALVLLRGNHLTPGKTVPRHFPTVIASDSPRALDEKSSGRLELANWLVDKKNPLTARVMVNRVWRWHFGQGLVRSVDNFGRLGEKPSHPELLDWLALRFIESGWSVKALHKRLMLSTTYQTSSAYDARAATVDPDNRYYWRMNIRRLEAEAIRDSLVAVGAGLDRSVGGPALQHVKNRDYLFDHTSKDKTNYDSRRRSLYLPVIRNNLFDIVQLFDGTDATVTNGDRATTTVATQALFWMNSPLLSTTAEKLAGRLLESKDLNDAGRLKQLYLTIFGRPPTDREAERAQSVIASFEQEQQSKESDTGKSRLRAWALVCHVLLAANEFVYVN